MNITKESEEMKVIKIEIKCNIPKKEFERRIEILKWWNKQGKKMKTGLTFIHIDELRSYKGLTFREIESIYKQYNKE